MKILAYLRADGPSTRIVDASNLSVGGNPPAGILGMSAELTIVVFEGQSATPMPASAFATIGSWRMSVDRDFSQTTAPLLRVTSGITVGSDGQIIVSIANLSSEPLATALGNSSSVQFTAELAGYGAGQTTPSFIVQFPLAVLNRIDLEGGSGSLPVTSDYYTRAQTEALLASTYEFQFSEDGSEWHSVQTSDDTRFRSRNSAVAGAQWSGAVILPSASGGGEMNVQSDWNETDVLSDAYILNKPTIPIVNDATVTITQGGVTKGSFTLNQSGNVTLALDAGGGGGTGDYTQLTNKPQIGGVTLSGNKTAADLGLVASVSGKGLSTEDYTTAEKTKLAGIAAGAEANVQSDWNATDTTSDAYIQNKPTIPTVNNPTIAFTQGGMAKGSFTLNQASGATIALDAGGEGGGALPIEFSSVTSNIATFQGIVPIVGVKTSAGKYHAVENSDVAFGANATTLDVTRYLLEDNLASFGGTWTAYCAAGRNISNIVTERTPVAFVTSPASIAEGGIYTTTLTSGQAIVLPTPSDTSKIVTAELWLTMPSTAVTFTLTTVTWIATPDFTTGGKTYCVAVRWDGARWLANVAYMA